MNRPGKNVTWLQARRPATSRRGLHGGLLAASAITALAVVAISAAPAYAGTWTVVPGGVSSGNAATTVLSDTVSPFTTITCTSSQLDSQFTTGSSLSGFHIGQILGLAYDSCSVGSTAYTVSPAHTPWPVNARKYVAPVTYGHITGIHLSLTAGSCTAVIDGTGATADDGSVRFRYSNGTHVLTFLAAGSGLHVYSPSSGCGTLFANGDAATLTSAYLLSNAQTITSP